MMCPSKIPLAASQIGSLKSSPSTNTVKKPVMVPTFPAPARSNKRGNNANTEGVYPLEAGGSPIARPISRCAMANRVTESMRKVTSIPKSRKCSAIVMAIDAAFKRTKAG